MKFEYAKYTEVTDLAHEVNPEYKKSGYTRIFICPDTWDVWLVRVLPGYNEKFEPEEGKFLLERDKIEHPNRKGEKMTVSRAKRMLEDDEFENWDMSEYDNEEDIIEDLADIFGILNLKEPEEEIK